MIIENECDEEDNEELNVIKGYSLVCLGGMFDYFYVGYKFLFYVIVFLIVFLGEKIWEFIIGIFGDVFLVKK